MPPESRFCARVCDRGGRPFSGSGSFRRAALVALAAASSIGVTGCLGPSDGSDQASEISFSCPGGPLSPGENTISIAGKTRRFYADFPADLPADFSAEQATPMAVLFSWHGFGQRAADFRAQVGFDPNADPTVPFVVITPEDSGLLPPAGLGWDIVGGAADGPNGNNVDIALFEGILGCLAAHHNVATERIYSFGFSAGSVMTNLLHSRYPDLFAAIASASGVWFNDDDEVALVRIPVFAWSWPPLELGGDGVVLLTHGGPGDVATLDVINLEDAARAALPFLAAAGRLVIDCPHDRGHALHPELSATQMIRFFSAHRAGLPSPYLETGPEGLATSCALLEP